MKIMYIFALLLIVGSFVVFFQNLQIVNFQFLKYSIDIPLAFGSAVLFLGGFLSAFFLIWPSKSFFREKFFELSEKNQKLKQKLTDSAIVFDSEGLGKEGEEYLGDANYTKPIESSDFEDLTGHKD